MNFLAHLFLADPSDASLVGNMLGDFVKGRLDDVPYPDDVVEGIRIHRRTDAFTDTHDVVIRSRQRIPEPYRRCAGIIVDLAYDHFLAANWEQYAQRTDLQAFATRAYDALLRHEPLLPPRLRRMLPHMVEHDWLVSYRRLANAERALDRIAGRLSAPELLLGGGAEIGRHYGALESDFHTFFPALVAHIESYKNRPSHRS